MTNPTTPQPSLLAADQERISVLLSSFADYLKCYGMNYRAPESTLTVSYTFWPYDLIDGDLDFDELEYDKMCCHFRKWLGAVLCDIAKERPSTCTCMHESRADFRNSDPIVIEEAAYVFDANRNAVRMTKQIWL